MAPSLSNDSLSFSSLNNADDFDSDAQKRRGNSTGFTPRGVKAGWADREGGGVIATSHILCFPCQYSFRPDNFPWRTPCRTLLGLPDVGADVLYRSPIPPEHIERIEEVQLGTGA
jgi:hypothetical protein